MQEDHVLHLLGQSAKQKNLPQDLKFQLRPSGFDSARFPTFLSSSTSSFGTDGKDGFEGCEDSVGETAQDGGTAIMGKVQ
jgi:hypothetical protein